MIIIDILNIIYNSSHASVPHSLRNSTAMHDQEKTRRQEPCSEKQKAEESTGDQRTTGTNSNRYSHRAVLRNPNKGKHQGQHDHSNHYGVTIYPPSNNHGSGKWPPAKTTFLYQEGVIHFNDCGREGSSRVDEKRLGSSIARESPSHRLFAFGVSLSGRNSPMPAPLPSRLKASAGKNAME